MNHLSYLLRDDILARREARVQHALDHGTSDVPGLATACHDIIEAVGRKHNYTTLQMMSARRLRGLNQARQEAMYRCITETPHGLPTIGRVFRRDHSTVWHGARVHAKRYGLPEPGRYS